MTERKQGRTQIAAAAKASISERTARRIETGQLTTEPAPKRHWRTRKDPLADVWDCELVPMLEDNPELLPMTLFEYLCDNYPGQYDNSILRTLQRRIKSWKAKHGPAKEVMFRQTKEPGRLGLSDFTQLKGITITLLGQVFCHLLYHYRLTFSGWCYVKVICGGESFTALSTGLQNALWRSGGVPLEHRTDSLSAAFNNLAEKEQLTERYQDLCRHYHLKPTRNNPGQSHENGAIESPHGHLKRRIRQALLLRGSYDFASLEDYQGFIDGVVSKINRQNRSRFEQERPYLQPLPKRRTQDYAEHRVLISRSSTFDLRRVTYTVPSRFISERLYVQLYDERLELFHGHEKVLVLPRAYASKTQRARQVDYRHVIDSLVKKPQAFRHSQLRDDLLPGPDYHRIWRHIDETLPPHKACRYIVRLLHLAATEQCESALGRYVLKHIDRGELPSELQCRKHFSGDATVVPLIVTKQHALGDYDQLLNRSQEVHHG
nr:IS21 family transposase [Aestuariicella hydrocarbonica]